MSKTMQDDADADRSRYPRSADQIGRKANLGLTKLWRAAVRLERLQTLLQAVLPPDIRGDQVRVASIKGPTLTLLVNSSAWASRLRFDVPVLLKRLAELSDFHGVQQIRLQVSSLSTSQSARQSARLTTSGNEPVERSMSPNAAATLRDCAASMPDGELRDTLLALAAHADRA